MNGPIHLSCTIGTAGDVTLACSAWEGFSLPRLSPALVLDGAERAPDGFRQLAPAEGETWAGEYAFGGDAWIELHCSATGGDGLVIRPLLRSGSRGFTLNRVTLLASGSPEPRFGGNPARVTVMEQKGYAGGVTPLAPRERAHRAAEETAFGTQQHDEAERSSTFFWLAFDRDAGRAFLAGFLGAERWIGTVTLRTDAGGGVHSWHAGFDGGDLAVGPEERIPLEPLLLGAGTDPWRMLEAYADLVAERFAPRFPDTPPVTWCSWYPYRLGVTEERLLENARVAAERLKPLGMSVIEVDLGWERGWLPCAFEENARFPGGLGRLSRELAKLGFVLGVWKAPYSISALDPVAKEHPEWLVRGPDGSPLSTGQWFWEPHGEVYILDLTHPGARQWLRTKIGSLAERGVGYFKADFIGCVMRTDARDRHDRRVVAGGGTEAARVGARIIREALPDALLLNCGGPLLPGTGQWPLVYACNDTGNTGFISWAFHRDNFQSLATRLFINRRWGIVQPSCLCVGLPGTLEEARVRATMAFLSGGQIDVSDTLTTLPEDRWRVLTATLPPLGLTATPVDLFDPLPRAPLSSYTKMTSGSGDSGGGGEHPPGSVWRLHVKADWDEWDLVAFFSFSTAEGPTTRDIDRFSVPLHRLGLDGTHGLWGYEFWSSQFLGPVPSARTNPGAYAHPGDYQDLAVGTDGNLAVAFFGPAVKLVALRRRREHPWPVGTTFHQGCGTELSGVRWDARKHRLSGTVSRPAGESGDLVIATTGREAVRADVGGKPVLPRLGASGALVVPVTLASSTAAWTVAFHPPR